MNLFPAEHRAPKVPLFVELCAGLAALSVRLQGGANARPPVSRIGNKAGYADCILAAIGLRPGDRAAAYLWCEPDDGARTLLMAYPRPDVLAEAAAHIRSWADEDPQALWGRLKAEGPIKGYAGMEVARFTYLQGSQFGGLGVTNIGGQLKAIPSDGRPRVLSWDMGGLKGAVGGGCKGLADALDGAPGWPPTLVTGDACPIMPQSLPVGSVVYFDPPYLGTTGYGSDLPRADVLILAGRWADAGATVVISEAVPLGSVVHEGIADAAPGELDGWHCYEITGQRVGQKRTFSAQQREWITMSRPADPVWAAGLARANTAARGKGAFVECKQVSLFAPAGRSRGSE